MRPLVLSFKDNSTVFKKGGGLNATERRKMRGQNVEVIDKYTYL
jgi:hypothetical protein